MRNRILFSLVAIFFTVVSFAQKTITGKVIDANGKPVSNASVVIKGTKSGTTTAADGTYSIKISGTAKSLEFSSVGFEAQSVSIGAKSVINVTLASSESKDLSEVVVTGISKVKKSQYAGAATKIEEKQLKNQPVGSFDQILQGRAPGITALTGSGQPGSPTNIIIRGQGSIEGGSDPLYIVDGIPVEAGVFQGLNPNDFASIDIFRDAASTSLYGSRGSAGVIVITTKKGSGGKMKFGYSAQFGVKSKPDFGFRPMSTPELLKAQDEYGSIVANGNPLNPVANNPAIPGFYYSPSNPRFASLTPGQQEENLRLLDSISKIQTNWYNEIFRNGTFSNHQITLSGGSGKTRVFSSLGLYKEEGITLRTDMNRVTFRSNVDYADDKFSLSVNTNLGYTKRNFQQSTTTNSLGNPFLTAAVAVPYASLFKPGTNNYATGIGTQYAAANQLDLTKYDLNYNNQIKTTLGVTANYKFTEHITGSVTTGIDFRETQNTNYGSKLAFNRAVSSSVTGKAGFQTEGLTRFFRGTFRPSFTYRNSFGTKHDVEVTALAEYLREYNKAMSTQAFGTDPKRPNTMAVILPSNATNQLYPNISGSKSENSLMSGLLTARYTFDGKYTITGSYREDGSSKLPEANRWQGFYAVGAIWDAKKESFMDNIKQINMLRVKLSYGGSGNADNFPGGNYPYQNSYSQGSYSGLNTIIATYPGNPDMKWESTFVTNFGVDFEILNRRIYGDLNIYNKITKDLFIQKTLSAAGGFGTGAALNINAGKLSNKGTEININAEVLRKKDLVVTLFANYGYNKNRVLSLAGEQPYESGTELIKEGMPLGTHYEVKWGGVDAATGMPLYYDKNGNLTNVYSQDNRVQDFGTWEAPHRGGFGMNARYKSFEFSMLFSWQKGSYKMDNMEYFVENPVGFMANGYNQSSSMIFWKKPGDIASTPSPLYGTNFSSKIIHDASFIRLRDVKLVYNLPKDMMKEIKFVSNASLFVQCSNLYIWTKWRGTDPEAGATNINLSEFPNPRTVTAGLDVTF